VGIPLLWVDDHGKVHFHFHVLVLRFVLDLMIEMWSMVSLVGGVTKKYWRWHWHLTIVESGSWWKNERR
jgi:hypothetical protein